MASIADIPVSNRVFLNNCMKGVERKQNNVSYQLRAMAIFVCEAEAQVGVWKNLKMVSNCSEKTWNGN